MPSFLGEYTNSARNKPDKFKRAVESIINQSYSNWELIIVSDGCDITVDLYKQFFSGNSQIKCFKIMKQVLFSGKVRDTGIKKATGKYIIYLDTDDFFGLNHLQIIKENIKEFDWCYYNVYFRGQDGKSEIECKEITTGSCNTSNICHKRKLNITWLGADGYCHEKFIIAQLLKFINFAKIKTPEYNVCHVPDLFES